MWNLPLAEWSINKKLMKMYYNVLKYSIRTYDSDYIEFNKKLDQPEDNLTQDLLTYFTLFKYGVDININ